jgi:hypothetical protein
MPTLPASETAAVELLQTIDPSYGDVPTLSIDAASAWQLFTEALMASADLVDAKVAGVRAAP